MSSEPAIDLSIVVPFLDEEGSLKELHRQLTETLQNAKLTYELIFIDDGSTDSSNKIVQDLKSHDEHIRLITFRRNSGKSAALAVGFKAAVGNRVVTLDADLQDDPKEIPNLWAALDSGYDLVSGWKKIRHDPFTKTIPSKIFNFVTGFLAGIPLHDFNCGLKMYRVEVVKDLRMFGERHRFIPVLAHMQGFRVGEIPVTHHPRQFGKTKFGAYRFIAGFFDLITLLFRMRFLTKPLHFFGSIGVVCLLFGLAILIYLTIGWFQGQWIGGRPLLMVGVLGVVTGLQFFTMGLIGEMIAEGRNIDDAPVRADSDI